MNTFVVNVPAMAAGTLDTIRATSGFGASCACGTLLVAAENSLVDVTGRMAFLMPAYVLDTR